LDRASIAGLIAGIATLVTTSSLGFFIIKWAFEAVEKSRIPLGYGAELFFIWTPILLLVAVLIEGVILGVLVAIAISWRR